jgi:hypothetical protein
MPPAAVACVGLCRMATLRINPNGWHAIRARFMPSIFVCYRRDDAAAHARLLYDSLARSFRGNRVFMDIDALAAGADFVEAIRSTILRTDVMLAVIGPGWVNSRNAAGTRRLQDPGDYVRLEIATALTIGITVIPILVSGAKIPPSSLLPEDIKSISRRQGFELSDRRWKTDVRDLIRELRMAPPSGAAAAAEWPERARESRSIYLGHLDADKRKVQRWFKDYLEVSPSRREFTVSSFILPTHQLLDLDIRNVISRSVLAVLCFSKAVGNILPKDFLVAFDIAKWKVDDFIVVVKLDDCDVAEPFNRFAVIDYCSDADSGAGRSMLNKMLERALAQSSQ